MESVEMYLVSAVGWYPRKLGVEDEREGPKRPKASVPSSWCEGQSRVPSRLRIPVAAESKEAAEERARGLECVEELRDEPTVIMEYTGDL